MEQLNMLMYAGAAVLLLVVVLTIIIANLRVVVQTDEVHIVQYHKITREYGYNKSDGNCYYRWPTWVPRLGVNVTIISATILQVNLKDYSAYDKNKLPFNTDVTAFFRVSDPSIMSQRMYSVEDLRAQMTTIVQGVVRKVLANDELENIMQERSKLSNEFTAETEHQIAEWGLVLVKNVEFMDIRDSVGSNVIANIMSKAESLIQKESRVTIAQNNQEAALKEIDAKRTVAVQEQDAMQQVGIRTAEKDRIVGVAKEQSNQSVIEQNKITVENEMQVQRVRNVKAAEIQKEVALVNADMGKQQAAIDQETAVINATKDRKQTEISAEAQLNAAKFNAEGIRSIGESKAAAEQAMLLAPVNTQIALAREIGSNGNYQNYLIQLEYIKAMTTVGVESAQAMQKADLKIIANSGDVQSGIGKLTDVFSPKGGTALSSMVTAFTQTDAGKAMFDKYFGSKESPSVSTIDVSDSSLINDAEVPYYDDENPNSFSV